jgi:VWA domain-containing protein
VKLHGVPLGALLAIFSAAGAVLAALYLLRQRRRRVEVAFLRLWSGERGRRDAARFLRRLRWPLSLLVQLALLALLVAALGDPRPDATGRHLAILLDASASMTATDVAPDRMTLARDEARRVVESMGPSDQAMIVRMDARPRPLGPLSSDAVALERLIDAVQPSHTAADLPRAFAMARDALRDRERPGVVLVGDGAWPEDLLARADLGGAELRSVVVGRSGDNLGIVAFAARRYPMDRESFEALAEVKSFLGHPTTARLHILADGVPLDTREIHLGPGETARLAFADLHATQGRFEARLEPAPGTDHFALDDRALALVGQPRRLRTLLVSDGNLFLEGALLLSEQVDLERVAPRDYRPPPADRWDVVVLDRFTPPEPPRAPGLIYVSPSGKGSPVETGATVSAPFLEGGAPHPLLRHVAWKDVNVARARVLRPAPGDATLAQSFGDPLVVAGTRGVARFLAVGFDLRQSDLVVRVAFPLLVRNALDWFSGEDDEPLLALAAGQTAHVPVPGGSLVDVVAPDGPRGRAPAKDGSVALWPDRVGTWRVGPVEIGVNLCDASESRIAPRAGAAAAFVPGRAALRHDPWVWLAASALLIGLLEWATFHRRLTV